MTAAALAQENARLHSELQAATARVVEAGDAERRRLERNLHDGAQQRLVTLAVHLRLLSLRLAPDPESDRILAAAQDELAASLRELRELAHGLHPAALSAWGLGTALGDLAARAIVPVQVVDRLGGARFDERVETAAYYVVSEALANLSKHADASRAVVTVRRRGGRLVVKIADDGVGGADPGAGSGLCGLSDRVNALGGRLLISSPAGVGTTVRAHIPLDIAARAA